MWWKIQRILVVKETIVVATALVHFYDRLQFRECSHAKKTGSFLNDVNKTNTINLFWFKPETYRASFATAVVVILDLCLLAIEMDTSVRGELFSLTSPRHVTEHWKTYILEERGVTERSFIVCMITKILITFRKSSY